MKVLGNIIRICALSCGLVSTSWATITFGSQSAGFVVPAGSTINFNGAVLTQGSVYNSGGTITNTASVCDGLVFETRSDTDSSSLIVDGSFNFGSALTLNDNDRLVVDGGVVATTITVDSLTSGPSIIEGAGRFDHTIGINQNKQLNMRWDSALNTNINSLDTGTIVKLEKDLSFASTYFFTGSEMTIDCNGKRLSFGGNGTEDTVIDNNQIWKTANVQLAGPVTLAADREITFSTAVGFVNGNGNTFSFLNDGSALNNNGLAITLTNIVFDNVNDQSFQGSTYWTLNNVTFQGQNNSITVTGTLSAGTVDIFGAGGGNAGFGSDVKLTLNKNCSLGGNWLVDGSLINGNGFCLDLEDATIVLEDDLTFADITLTNVGASSFSNSDSFYVYLSNVDWIGTNGALTITGCAAAAQGASIWLFDGVGNSDIFTSPETEFYDAVITLKSDILLSSTWSFYPDQTNHVTIEGCGHTISFVHDVDGSNDGSLFVASDCSLTLSNVVLDDVTLAAFASGSSGSIYLSNVTIKLAGNVDLSEWSTYFIISGPVTFVTGEHVFTTWSDGGNGSQIDGVTVFYDTLSLTDGNNVQGFNLANSGRLLFVTTPVVGDITIVSTGSVTLNSNQSLSNTSDGVVGRSLSFTANGLTTYDGEGRSISFPSVIDEQALLSVSADSVVNTTNIVFQGLKPQQMSVLGVLFFGDKTIIRLDQDWILDRTLMFGTTFDATAEAMTLDLCGYTIDMSDTDAHIFLQGGTDNVLRICNGRIIGLGGFRLQAQQDNGKIILENIDLVLNSSTESIGEGIFGYSFGYSAAEESVVAADLLIQGNCAISGLSGFQFRNISAGSVTIDSGSMLTIYDGITYLHNADVDTFSMTDSSSCLQLIGSNFSFVSTDNSSPAPLTLADGTLIVDHLSTIDVGSAGMRLDSSLNVQIRPSATITVLGAGTLAYVPAA